ncbi:MAG: Dam family site-specific DNA-(adenine-N6)-methyltransferase [Anaerolineaceae bacterium]|nr:Dam family site-specific DNA-(adenine-N6)-methyltransferase [Anaerolineaceae bacterium]
MQPLLFKEPGVKPVKPFTRQLLKWVGNKQRFACEIASYFPVDYGTYFEPFLGTGAVLATLAPAKAVGSDCFPPLMEIWATLQLAPELLKEWYAERWNLFMSGNPQEEYERIKASYNVQPNGADLLFLCRSCYGGVVRFRKDDGHMSTPCGIHRPISPVKFAKRVDEWRHRTIHTEFLLLDYEHAMDMATPGDLVYCDPPYSHSQAILYGAQDFSLEHLLQVIGRCKARGVYVALSIDGKKRTESKLLKLPIPDGLFEREALVNCGRSMLKRFQMNGQSLEKEEVADRLLLTY